MRFLFRKNKQAKTRRFHKVKAEKGFKKSIGMGHEYCLYAGNGACRQSYDGKSI